jgi:predicted negative regulator of RcsB-dependent stress response
MVDDYLSDREQEEALRAWWRDNWRWILGGIVLGIALLFGWFRWKDYREDRGVAAGTQYEAVRVASEQRKLEDAQKALTELTAEHDASPYTQQARLLVAKLQVDAGKLDEAAVTLREVTEKSKDEELAGVAKLRLARIFIQQGKHEDALALLEVEKLGAFAAAAREIRGDAQVAKGDENAARAEYAAALAADDAQIDRNMLELKLQEVGGSAADSPPAAPSDATAKAQGQP